MYMFFYPHFCALNAMYFWTSSPFKTREVGWKLVDQNQKSPDWYKAILGIVAIPTIYTLYIYKFFLYKYIYYLYNIIIY